MRAHRVGAVRYFSFSTPSRGSRMRYDSGGRATTPGEIGSIVVLLGVVGFIVFLAWGAGPTGTRNVAHTSITRAETTGMGGSYDLLRRVSAPPVTDAIELSR